MKHKTVVFLLSLALLFSGLGGTAYAASDTADRVEALIGGIAAYMVKTNEVSDLQALADTFFKDNAGSGAEWYALALKQYKDTPDLTLYTAALQQAAKEENISKVTQGQLIALTLIFMDDPDNAFIKKTAENSLGEMGLMSWIYGLLLLNNAGDNAKITRKQAIKELLSQRKADGGWALWGDYSDVDVTAMTIQALAPHYDDPEVKQAVDEALTLLSERQLEDGGYQGFGEENCESLAQVICAVSALEIDPVKDPRFIKNGRTVLDALEDFHREDGSFSHVAGAGTNMTATTQTFYSLVALWRAQQGLGSLYIYDPEEHNKAPSEEQSSSAEWTEEGTETEEPTETTAESDTKDQPTTAEPTISTDPGTKDPGPKDPGQTDPARTPAKKLSYKVFVIGGIALLMLLSCIILAVKKKSLKHYLSVLIVGALASLVILFTNFSKPEDYYNSAASEKENVIGQVTLTIRCDTIVGKSDSPYIPEDGVILPVTAFSITEGETVFDILTEAARRYNIQMENSGSVMGAHGKTYISGINYLYQLDFGELSGWVYHVNGVSASVGCGEYVLTDGDFIEWLYTLDLGNDVE